MQGGRRAPVARPSAKVAAVSDHASGEVSVSEEEGKDDVEESDVKEQVVVKSAWAQELEQDVGHAERDVTRRTTFAFVEIGVEKHVSGAVWVREGETGVLRLAQEEERRLLLGEVRARDTEAWK